MAPSRDDNKRRVRESLANAAMRLFVAQGFEGTTVEAIAEAAGCSRRTFFRYFPNKEAVVFSRREERLAAFERMLAAALRTAPPLSAVRDACLRIGEDYAARPRAELTRQRVVAASPRLVAAELTIYDQWEAAIVSAVTGRRASARRRRQAQIFAAATLGVLRTTLREWYASKGRKNLLKLGEQAFDVLAAGFDEHAMP